MAVQQPFMPQYGSTQTVAVTTSSAPTTLAKPEASNLRILNTGAGLVYFRTYLLANAAPATAADMPVASGQATTVTKPKDHDTIAFLGAGAYTVLITAGEGT